MSDSVQLIECPRDAWQGLEGQIPTDLKVNYLQALISAGFKHIDAVSFVSPKAVPQMADSEEVLKELDPPDDVKIIAIVVNEKGAQRATGAQGVTTLGFPYSVSPTFLSKNQRQTPEEALDELEVPLDLARRLGDLDESLVAGGEHFGQGEDVVVDHRVGHHRRPVEVGLGDERVVRGGIRAARNER